MEVSTRDRFQSDRENEMDRVFAAYCKEHKIDRVDLDDILLRGGGHNAIQELMQKAWAERDLYAIPRTDADHLYHGTAKARLASIQADGLAPQERSRWAKDGYAGHCSGRVFFTDTISNAMFYAREASKTSPALLRVNRSALNDLQADAREVDGNWFIEGAVPPHEIEAWSGKGWKQLAPAPAVVPEADNAPSPSLGM